MNTNIKEIRILLVILTAFLCPDSFAGKSGKPSEPGGVVVIPNSPSSFLIGWEDTSRNELGFRIERRAVGEEWVSQGIAPADETTFTTMGALAYGEYEHRVIAFNDSGEAPSPPVTRKAMALHNQRFGRIIESSSARQGEGCFVKLENGDIALYFSDMVTVSDLAEARISKKVSADDGRTWSDQEVVFAEKGLALFLPSAMRLDNGEIALSYARRVPGEWYAKRVLRFSSDEGKTWSEEISVTDGKHNYQTGSHDRFYKLSNGDLIILVHALDGAPDRPRHFVTDVYGSTDKGRSWECWTKTSLDAPVNPHESGEYGLWECSIAELEPGNLLMYGRTASGWIYESRSTDYGRTWTQPEQTNIRNPLAPPYLKRIPGTSTLMLIGTTRVNAEEWLLGYRYSLGLRISRDGGRTWGNFKDIEYHSHDWYYDYPNVLFDENFLHLSYRAIELSPDKNWERVNLGYIKLPLSWVLE